MIGGGVGTSRAACLVECKRIRKYKRRVRQALTFDSEVYQFIFEQIETVPHLEALLLIWNSRPQPWTVENLTQRLYVPNDAVRSLLQNLARRGLIAVVHGPPEGYRYESASPEQDQLMTAVDATYRHDLVRISTMIHSKPPSSLRDFARAFRLTKERP